MAIDYGFFEALTGPMTAAGDIHNNRQQRILQKQQQEQQIRNMQLQELDRAQAKQQMLNTATDNALKDLYTANNFARQKDIDDFTNWHRDLSGWGNIQDVLTEYGSVTNARIYGNLDYLLEEYKANLKNNPVSRRAKKNKAALELYHSNAMDKKNAQFVTSGARERYNRFVNGESDNFIFNGVRGDYLDQTSKVLTKAQNVDIDQVIGSNYQAIITDMINDVNPENPQEFMQGLSHQDIRNWVTRELNYSEMDGVAYFNDEPIYGNKEIDTQFSTELVRSLDAVGLTGIAKGSDYFKFKDSNISFKEAFDSSDAAINWERLGGYDKNDEMKSYKGKKAIFAKGRQMVGSGRIFANNPKLETTITDSWAGTYTGKKSDISRYNSKNRQVNDVSMVGLYDSRGHKITQDDVASTWLGGAGSWEESERDDLRLTGYHIALEGKNKDGDAFLLTDVSNEADMNKLREQYKDTVFDYVIVAELIDDDMISHDDAYYKKIDLGDPNVQGILNDRISAENLNEVKGQMADYEQQLAHTQYANKRKLANNAILQKQLNLPNPESVDQLVGAYDKSLTVGLSMANVSARRIQQAMPMIMSDLYVESQRQREYPHDFTPNETDPNKKMVARNPSEYMAYSTQILKTGLVSNSSNIMDMLKAIQDGNYDMYSQSVLSSKDYKISRKISKSISQYQSK